MTDAVNPLLLMCCGFVILYVSIFVHELGHALLGRLVGFVVTSFGLGTGHPWFKVALGRLRVFLCWSHPFQGLTFYFTPRLAASKRQLVPFLAGGIFANLFLVFFAVALSRYFPRANAIWLATAAVNGLLAVTSLAPYQARVGKAVVRSDGRLIQNALQGRVFLMPAPLIIQSVKALRGLWEAI